jgi:hypothetical protein
MASADVEMRRRRMRKLVWGLGTKVDMKQIVVGCVLLCISASAVTMDMSQAAIADTPMSGARLLAAFVFLAAALAGYMIMHRGTERSWL